MSLVIKFQWLLRKVESWFLIFGLLGVVLVGKEMKNLREQYAEFKDQGVRFMSISLDDSVEKWKKACEEEQIPWISVRDDNGWSKSEIRKLFGIQAIPFIVLLDKDGNIVAKNIRRNSLREKILELLQK